MHKLLLPCSLVFSLCLGLCTLFGVKAMAQPFQNFSLDVPSTWHLEQEVDSYSFYTPQKDCVFNIIVTPHQDTTFREFVIGFYQNLQGKHAKNVDNGVTFDMITPHNIPGKARVSMQGEHVAVVTAVGQCFAHTSILYSLRILDAQQRPLEGNTRPYPLLQKN